MSGQKCFHCGEQVPPGEDRTVTVNGREEPVCCTGCHAVANMILGSGLEKFYQVRTSAGARPDDEAVASSPDQWSAYDRDEVQRDFVRIGDGPREGSFLVENLYCAACGWLIEHLLSQVDGVLDVRVNAATGRAIIRWEQERAPLSFLLREMARLGYRAHPLRADKVRSMADQERRKALRRLIVSGLGTMQVMMLGIGLYLGDYYGMDAVHEQFLRLVSLLVATPVLFYAGAPFFIGAYRDIRARTVGMDVPVSLAIGITYTASLWWTLTDGPKVYFDSVVMFIFFLGVARFAEMAARHKANETTDALARLIPSNATRVTEQGEEQVPVADLRTGDILLVRSGETVPADGELIWGEGNLDESLLTGESMPQSRGEGERLVGGSLNTAGVFRMRVEALGQDTVLSSISRLLARAQADRPRLARVANWVAARFISVVLVAAVGVFAWWWQHDPVQAFPVLMAVLAATCPCALAMATPMAIAGGTNRLARSGLLITQRDALETMTKVGHVVFDKTGTLTRGELRVERIELLTDEPGLDETRALALAGGLERHSEHPIARAFDGHGQRLAFDDVEAVRGDGVRGALDGDEYRIGLPRFACDQAVGEGEPSDEGSWVVLARNGQPLARFQLADRPREDAAELVAALKARGLTVELASGDHPAVVEAVARRLGIDRWQARMRPDDKLARIREIQAQGVKVAMVGDGLNDAPVLAGADVAIAMNTGTALAQTSADMVLLGERLTPVERGFHWAHQSRRIMIQNLTLSACYNFSALPLAAVGFLTPWMAALGMAGSSILVILNASRLSRGQRPVAACPVPVGRGKIQAQPVPGRS
ncbi:heavy metal translocating P-type ATPase [Alkalilimnicola ehrlichii MLHE-1]|uniref:Heavy metal translocating P-type ATPase n=1 Tax=Alkalilimnicola ehrlichii (strain ATCC BAA-1101 / DSM 17681 / MLHE-1) TaxID=187272 RepID=Q0A7G8_ALKEH|nr:heavy metal translocating P-type ATPase [Alkalilimnicola ehrlichii]ABI57219.1 heavy metal translocating P-type ATPase [Alkalilimnicola ehrlichii MLHE-1]